MQTLESNFTYKTKDYTIKDYYNSYMNLVETEGYVYIDYKTFRSVLEDYFKHIAFSIIENGNRILLPARMGEICIKKYKSNVNTLQYDYQESKKIGKPVWHFNDHTDGYRYKYYWFKKNVLIRNSTKYQMVFTRNNKRRLAEILKNKERDYIEL